LKSYATKITSTKPYYTRVMEATPPDLLELFEKMYTRYYNQLESNNPSKRIEAYQYLEVMWRGYRLGKGLSQSLPEDEPNVNTG